MKTITITRREIEKARQTSSIPASERPWGRSTIYKSGKEYKRHPKHRNREE
jgi:hypothetical protein